MLEQVWLYAWGLVLRSPDIVGLALLLVIVLSALQVLLVARRVVGWIVGAVVRVAFWSAVVLVLSVLYQRGLEATVRDALAIGEKVWGYAVVTAEIWRREYARYSAEAAAAGSSRRAAAAGRYDWSQGRRKTR